MNARQTVEKVSTCLLLLLYALAHALAVVGLLAFGLRADGWVLHPVALGWYGLFVLGSLVLLGRSWRQGSYHWPLVVPPILALAALGAFPATGLLGGTAYAPYDPGDLHEWFVGLNVLSALALSAAALLYRWPRLLLAWAMAQGLLLVTYPAWWARLYRWGGLGNPLPVAVLTVGLALLYVLAARTLGVRLPRRWGRWVLIGLTVGIGLTVLAVLRHAAYTQGRGLPREAVLLPLNLAFGASLMPLPLLAWQALQERPEEGEQRFPWEALALILWAATALATSYLTPGRTLPAPGDVQGWQSPDHVVPDAWLPTITWAGWLFVAVRWLLIPYALLGLVEALRRARPRPAVPTFPGVLLWAGVAWLAAYAWDFSRLGFPLRVAVEPRSVLESFLPLPGGVLLLLAGRAWERRWGRMAGGFWRLVTVGSLLALLLWTEQAAWAYGRVLLAPLPAWADRWQYAPLPPTLLVGLGLVVHLIVLGLGIFGLGATLRAWMGAGPVTGQRGLSSLVRAVTPPLLLLTALAGLWWWATAPPVVRTVPPNGATAVPRDTVVHIQMGSEREWLGLLLGGSGQGIRTYYADTGDTIPGMSGGTGNSFRFVPDGLLRPNAPVEITVHRTGERPYTLRFTTDGVESPTADGTLAPTWSRYREGCSALKK